MVSGDRFISPCVHHQGCFDFIRPEGTCDISDILYLGIRLGCTDQAPSTVVIHVNIFHMKRMGFEEMGLKL